MALQCKCSDNCACRSCRHLLELRIIALHFRNEGGTEFGDKLLQIYEDLDLELRRSARGQLRQQPHGATPQVYWRQH